MDYELKEAGRFLAQIVGEATFKFWQEKEFREYINFDSISKTEQDRIFNELEASLLGLFALNLDSLKSQVVGEQETEQLLTKLQEFIVDGFLSINRDLGVEERFIKTWETLIQMRLEEYREDFKMLLIESANDPKFSQVAEFKYIWARTQVINLDCLSHIRRGELKKEDPLRVYLQKFIIEFDQTFGENFKHIIFQPQGFA